MMAIPVYLWLYDDSGKLIKGSVDIAGREHSIEVLALRHMVELYTDGNARGNVGPCEHQSFSFDKEMDLSSVYLYKALTTGACISSAEFKYYHVNTAGQEQCYYSVMLEGVIVESIISSMYDTKGSYGMVRGHLEFIDFSYEKIKWHHFGSNVAFTSVRE